MSAIHICNAPGCTRRAVRPCFDCGEWRCAEHLLAAVHHRKSAVVHLCPNCLHAHVHAPDRLRIDGLVDERAERAADPLAPREGPRDQIDWITPLESNSLVSRMEPAEFTRLWHLERASAPHSTKRPAGTALSAREP